MKAFYLRKKFRGTHINDVADDFVRGFTSMKVTHMEIWAFPEVQKWRTRRYGIVPRIHVTHNPIEIFKIIRNR